MESLIPRREPPGKRGKVKIASGRGLTLDRGSMTKHRSPGRSSHSGGSPGADLDEIWSILKRSGLRRTEPREALLTVLASEHGPFSVETLHERVAKKKIDLVTVYRCVAAFEEAGVLRRCDFGDSIARYELEAGHHHHHVICRSCRQTESLDDCVLEKFDQMIEKMGYTKVGHRLEFFGVCSKCQK